MFKCDRIEYLYDIYSNKVVKIVFKMSKNDYVKVNDYIEYIVMNAHKHRIP